MTDRLTVAMVALAAFLVLLALLAMQLGGASPAHRTARNVLLRRVYETTVIERVPASAAAGAPGATSVTQSVSGPSASPSTPVTRTS